MPPKRPDPDDPASGPSADRETGPDAGAAPPAQPSGGAQPGNRRQQQVRVKKQVNLFMEGLAEFAAELDLGSPGEVNSHTEVEAGVEAIAEPVVPELVAGGARAAAAVAGRVPPHVRAAHPWTPELAMAPLEPLAPPPPRPVPAPLPPDVAAPNSGGGPVIPPILMVMVAILVVVVIAVLIFLADRGTPTAPSVAPTAPSARASVGRQPSPQPPDITVVTLRMVDPGRATGPFTAPAIADFTGATPSLLFVIDYTLHSGDGSIGIALSGTTSPREPVASVLSRAYLLTGSGEDAITLTAPSGTFPPGHYILNVTRTDRQLGTLTFDILAGPVPRPGE